MAANQQLQAGVQKFGNINTFGDVIAKNPDFDTWEPQEKKELADMFFSEKYADLSPDEQMELRPQFDAKYLSKPQGGVDLASGPVSSPPQDTNFLGDLLSTAVNSGSAGLIDMPHGEGVGSAIGNFLGPAVGTLSAVALAPETGGASLAIPAAYMGAVGAGTTAREQYNRTGRIDNPLAVGTSGLTNAALGLLGPVGRGATLAGRVVKNAAAGGIENTLQDLIQQAAEQQSLAPKLDMERIQKALLTGAGLGGGLAFKGEKAPAEAVPTYRGRRVTMDAPVGRLYIGRPQEVAQKLYQAAVTRVVEHRRAGRKAEANQFLKNIDPQTAQRIVADVKAFEAKDKARQAVKTKQLQASVQKLGPDAAKKKQLNELKKAIQERYAPEERTAKVKQTADQQIRVIQARAQAVKEVLADKRSDAVAKNEAQRELVRLKAEYKAAQAEQTYRDKEALQSKKPAPAKVAKPAKEKKQPDRETTYPAKKAGKVEREQRADRLPGLEEVKSHPEVKRRPALIKAAEQSYLKNEYVKPKYNAEIVGQDIDKLPGDGIVVKGIRETKAGDIMLSVMDSEGQLKTLKLYDSREGSRLDSLTFTGKKSPYELVGDLEDLTKKGTPRQRALNTETGELTAQYKARETIKTSELKAAVEVLERFKKGEATPREVIGVTKELTLDEFKDATSGFTQKEINDLGKGTGCG